MKARGGFIAPWALSNTAMKSEALKHNGRYYDEVLMVNFLDERLS